MPLHNPAAIIFDYGSVLVGPQDRAAFDESLDQLAHEYGFEQGLDLWYHIYISDAWEQAKRGRISHEALWIDRLRALGIKDATGRTAFKRRLFAHWGFYEPMRDLLHQLKDAGYRLAILSNTSRQEFRTYLEQRRGLTDLFDVVVSSAEVGYAKPEPDIYRITLEKMGLPGEKTLFIDDQERNTNAAEAEGIPSIVFTNPPSLRDELESRGII